MHIDRLVFAISGGLHRNVPRGYDAQKTGIQIRFRMRVIQVFSVVP
jgi:hypothetical protein